MKRTVLIAVTSDPRSSGRPAEAIRIAAGLSTHERLAVTLYLRGPAVLALTEDADALVDGDYFAQYLPVLAHTGQIVVAAGSPELTTGITTTFSVQQLRESQLRTLLAQSDRVLNF